MPDDLTGSPSAMPPRLPRSAVVDRYFLEHRAKLLDLAAFLDRCDRAPAPTPAPGNAPGSAPLCRDAQRSASASAPAPDDPRLTALRHAIALLTDDHPHRTRRILELLSDLSDTPSSDL